MLGARLAREEHELLGADAVRVHVDDELEPDLVEARQTEVGDFDRLALGRVQHDAGFGKRCRGSLPGRAELLLRQHVSHRRQPVAGLEHRLRPSGERFVGGHVQPSESASRTIMLKRAAT